MLTVRFSSRTPLQAFNSISEEVEMSFPVWLPLSTLVIVAVPIIITARTVLRSLSTSVRGRSADRSTASGNDEFTEATGRSDLPPNVIDANSLL